MTNPDDPAFLTIENYPSGTKTISAGLTKREHFAALMLQGFCSYESKETNSMSIDDWESKWAKTACRIADALIVELNKDNKR